MLRDYSRELVEVQHDRQLFLTKLRQLPRAESKGELLEKYRFYIKDLLQRKDGKAATFCLAMLSLEGRFIAAKATAFQRLVDSGGATSPERVRFPIAIADVLAQKTLLLKAVAFRKISSQGKQPQQPAGSAAMQLALLANKLNMASSSNLQTAFHKMRLQAAHTKLAFQQKRISQLEQENCRLSEQLCRKPSPNSTSSQPIDYQRFLQLDLKLKERDRDIKNLIRAAKQAETRYQDKLEKLEEQLNKLSHINSRLTQQLEEVRQRRGDLSYILPQPGADNSLSLQIFEQDQKGRELQHELSQKYLRQVIQLKQTLQSIKINFLSLLDCDPKCSANGCMFNRGAFLNLMYLLNLSDEERKKARQNPILADLLR